MLNEQQLEALCLGWLQEIGWRFAHGPDIAPDSHTDVVARVLKQAGSLANTWSNWPNPTRKSS